MLSQGKYFFLKHNGCCVICPYEGLRELVRIAYACFSPSVPGARRARKLSLVARGSQGPLCLLGQGAFMETRWSTALLVDELEGIEVLRRRRGHGPC